MKPSEFLKENGCKILNCLNNQVNNLKELDEKFMSKVEVEEIVDKYEAKIRELKQKLKGECK